MSFFTNKDPWVEDSETAVGVTIVEVGILSQHLKLHQRVLPKATKRLPDLLMQVVATLQADADMYRRNRRLFVQEVPAFSGLINALVKAKENSDGSGVVVDAITELTASVILASEHITAECSALVQAPTLGLAASAKLGWATLPGVAKQVGGAVVTTAQSPLGTLRSAAVATTGVVSGAASSAGGLFVSITSESALRVNAAGKLARIAGTTALTTVRSVTFDPIALYTGAAVKTLWATGGLAAVVGLVTLVIFAPAAPFTAGLAVFTAPDTYAEILAADMDEAERQRRLKQAGAGDDFLAAWTELKGQRVIRIDTPYITAELDVVSKKIDGTVLAGRYSGQRLSDIDNRDYAAVLELYRYAPDKETKSLLTEFLEKPVVAKSATKTSPKNQDQNLTGDLIGLGLDVLLLGALEA